MRAQSVLDDSSEFSMSPHASGRSLVVVIVGAAGRVGHATAVAFARRGATLVLAAGDTLALAPVVTECLAQGGAALGIPTDVLDAGSLDKLARRAVNHYGRIDVWVNAADAEVVEQWHGAQAALRHFRDTGHGLLVNLDASADEDGAASVQELIKRLRAQVAEQPGVQIGDVRTDPDEASVAQEIVDLALSAAPEDVLWQDESSVHGIAAGVDPRKAAEVAAAVSIVLGSLGLAFGLWWGRRRD